MTLRELLTVSKYEQLRRAQNHDQELLARCTNPGDCAEIERRIADRELALANADRALSERHSGVHFKLTADEKRLLQGAANEAGVNLSEYVRSKVLESENERR